MGNARSKEVAAPRSSGTGLRKTVGSFGGSMRMRRRNSVPNMRQQEEDENDRQRDNLPPEPPLNNIKEIRKPGSFHEALVRERDKKHDFDDIYEVLNEIGNGGLCKIFRVQKYDDRIGGSSRPEGVRKRGGRVRRSTQVHRHHNHSLHNHSPRSSGRATLGFLTHSAAVAHEDLSATGAAAEDVDLSSASALDQCRHAGVTLGERAHSNGSNPIMYFALKVINLALVKEDNIDQLKNEVEILKTLDHKNIIKAYETFQMKKYKKLMIVMELCTGGDMYARMPYTEVQVASAMRQILSAIAYMHSKHIIHRDIKMENIMWESQHPLAAIKVIDFGLSKRYSPHNDILTERVGTLYSMSPETMKGIYTAQADAWSIGVITYIMLSMEKPFEGDTPKQLVANVLQCNYTFKTVSRPSEDKNIWDKISELAKAFIRNLLVLEPHERMTADQAKTHEWFNMCMHQRRPESSHGTSSSHTKGNGSSTSGSTMASNDSSAVLPTLQSNANAEYWEETPEQDDKPEAEESFMLPTTEEFKDRVRKNIVSYADMGEFRRLALNVIAKKSTSDEIFELRRVFDEFDTLNTGTITLEEFKVALATFNYTEVEIMNIFRKVDVNGNNVINYTEFLAAALEAQGNIEEYRIAEAFDMLDSDDSGYISRENLRQLLGDRAKDEAYIDRLIAEADFKKDGRISYEEFLQVFSRQQRKESVAHLYHEHSKSAGSREQQEHEAKKVLKEHGIVPPLSDNTATSSENEADDNKNNSTLPHTPPTDLDEFHDAKQSPEEISPPPKIKKLPQLPVGLRPEQAPPTMLFNIFNPLAS